MRRSAAVPLAVIPAVLAGCGSSSTPMHCIDQTTQQVASDEWCAQPTPVHPGFVWYYGGMLYSGGYVRGGSYIANPSVRYVTPSRSFEAIPGSGGRVAPVRGGFGSVGSGHASGE
jgi:hypothetical protein